MQCELALGAGWAFQPRRWRTADGYVPYSVCWAYWRALTMQRAAAALDTAQGIGLALGDSESSVRNAIAASLPTE